MLEQLLGQIDSEALNPAWPILIWVFELDTPSRNSRWSYLWIDHNDSIVSH